MKDFLITRCKADQSHVDGKPARLRINDAGDIAYVDTQAEQFFGLDALELLGKPLTRFVASRMDNPLARQHKERLLQGQTLLLTFRHRDGHFIAGQLSLYEPEDTSRASVDTHIESMNGQALDPRLFNLTQDAVGFGAWDMDPEFRRMRWSDGIYRLLDLRPGQDVNSEHALYYFQDQHLRIQAALRRCVRLNKPFDLEICALTARQRQRWLRLQGRALRQGDRTVRLVGCLSDVSAQREALARRDDSQHLLNAVLQASEDLIVAVDRKLRLLTFNRAFAQQFERTFGHQPAVGDALLQLLERFPNERRLYQRLWERAFERESFSVEMPLAQQEREMPIYEINYHRLNNAQGQAVGALHIARNIQARQRGHEQLGYMNTHDPMTGLLNRRELLQRLRRALEAQRERGTACSLLYLDLDDYSQMLERAGGSACDRYLRELAALLASRVRQRDSVARVAGDKFALLLDNCAEAEARKVSDNLMDALREFTFEWRGHTLQTTASGGLIPLTGSADDPLPEAESLLALAADLCQTAKNAGRDRVHVYRDPRGGMLGGDEARLQLRQLEQCVQEEGGIELHYQLIRPITSATWGDHVEILARLRGPGMGDTLWQPTSFLPLAERYDLACQLDRKVIQKTFAWLAGQTILETRLKLCSFNLSLPSLLDTSFPEFVSEQLIQTRYAANCFCFEVRESDAVAHPAAVIQLCESLRALGCQMALDGAGTSAQSYALAARLPVDWLKLDARVVRSMKDDPVQQVMVEALTKVAEVSGKKTVALYIEDDDILKEVRRMGVHFGQGFRLANPRPLDELAPVTLEHGQGRR